MASFDPSRYVAPHPRPFMPYHFPQFDTYPSIRQAALRPTWAGFQPQLQRMVPGGIRGLGEVAPSPLLTTAGIVGVTAALALGLGAGFLIWGRR